MTKAMNRGNESGAMNRSPVCQLISAGAGRPGFFKNTVQSLAVAKNGGCQQGTIAVWPNRDSGIVGFLRTFRCVVCPDALDIPGI